MKVRPREVPVAEATRWFKPGDHPACTHEMKAEGSEIRYGVVMGAGNVPQHIVMRGDWIVETHPGRYRILRDDVFQAEYEPVEEQ
jgi:hypothetical protein